MAANEPQWSAIATKPPPIRGLPLAMSIREFCTAHRISEDMFFKMRRQGWGPAVMRVGTRRLISVETAAEWRKAREQAATATLADGTHHKGGERSVRTGDPRGRSATNRLDQEG